MKAIKDPNEKEKGEDGTDDPVLDGSGAAEVPEASEELEGTGALVD